MKASSQPKKALIVGLGGIGSQLVELAIPALRRIGIQCHISLMDADTVEAGNLGHQRFTENDIGKSKALVLAKKHGPSMHGVDVIGLDDNLRTPLQLQRFDCVIVCVDRPAPRRMVHSLEVPWVDLRCTGDGWVVLSSDSNPALVEQMTQDHEPKSCQVEGALRVGNLEFGFAVAAAFGAQWLVQLLRRYPSPTQSMGSLTYGMFEFPVRTSTDVEVMA
ncbi:MAG: hypothetical protein CMA63_07730 [Euryarchaeota archaeon]|nr:hypothetical protein [Euryarchaeota archaeon]|tara:strand:- start:9298 stop:9954 length:657 start_codon:yes stop_codon:yes gene_type:complete